MVLKNKKAEKGNRIDRWIDSWFAHGRKSEDTEILLMRISHEVAMLAEQKEYATSIATVYEVTERKPENMQRIWQRNSVSLE